MSKTWLLVATAMATLALMLGSLCLLWQMRRQERLTARVQLSRGIAPAANQDRRDMVKSTWTRLLRGLGQFILRTGLLSARTRTELEHTLAAAGLRGRHGLELFIGGKLALVAVCPFLAMVALRNFSLPPIVTVAGPALAAAIGLLLPDFIVRIRRQSYIARVERGLPDALDLLVICAQAGLGLTTSITRVAEEMQRGRQDIGTELALTATELELLADNRAALLNMGTRTGVEGLVRLSTTLVQSMRYGTPLGESMRILSAEMRQETLIRFENKAAKLGVMLTLPMILFILPCVFLVVGGPAAVQVMQIGN